MKEYKKPDMEKITYLADVLDGSPFGAEGFTEDLELWPGL